MSEDLELLKTYTNESLTKEDLDLLFTQHCETDPYLEIQPALLNPWDVIRYVQKTGMIFPFDSKNLKTITYQIFLYGDIYYWDNNEQKKVAFNRTDQCLFELKPNSIIYVHLDTVFRVPYYIALRFNLKIDLVHKGLLLGTGPVIDSGFQGRILIPIHNLTSNSYTLKSGDGLIWVEFTKLSSFGEKYKKFKSFLDLTANDYFSSSGILQGVTSSIPKAMQSAQVSAENAANEVKKLSRAGIIGILITVIGMIYPTWSLFNDLNSAFSEKKDKLVQEIKTELEYKLSEKEQAIQKMSDLIKNSEERINALEASQKQNAKKQNKTN